MKNKEKYFFVDQVKNKILIKKSLVIDDKYGICLQKCRQNVDKTR